MLLGEYLTHPDRQRITDEQLKIALDEQTALGGKELLGEILVRLGFVSRADITQALSIIAPGALVRNMSTATDIPRDYLRDTRTVILGGGSGTSIFVATLHPDPQEVSCYIEERTKRKVVLQPVPSDSIHEEMLKYSSQDTTEKVSLHAENDVNRVISTLITDAHRLGASDIHYEPQEKTMLIRYRIDSIMHEVTVLPQALATRLISRLKDLAKMDVAQKMKPLDGSFSYGIDGRSIDFRVSTIPLSTGEKVVTRLLDREKNLKSLDELGITKVDEWKDLTTNRNGLILVCGATGSGKTTTLYSTITHMNRLQRSINTIEDPIEYKLSFCNQAQVNNDTGFTFGKYSKTILRQDPDVIVIGETRDEETAHNSIHAATTGHLVLTTLHTTDVQTTINRLMGMKIDKQLLSFVLRAIMVQRLARKLCTHCGKKGCPNCHGTGYKDMTLLTEFARITTPSDVDRILKGDFPFHTFQMDAQYKLEQGITDEEELQRILKK